MPEEEFLYWNKEECEKRLSLEPNDLKAIFRLALIEMQERNFQKALNLLLTVDQKDPQFMRVHVCMKIGETLIKQEGKNDQALEWFIKAEEAIAPNKDYLITLFKAKSLDRLKRYDEAIEAFKQCIILYRTEDFVEDQFLGNLHFRLGWTQIRSRLNSSQGIENLKIAQQLLP